MVCFDAWCYNFNLHCCSDDAGDNTKNPSRYSAEIESLTAKLRYRVNKRHGPRGPPPPRGKKKLIGVPGQPGSVVPAGQVAMDAVDAVRPADGQVN